MPKIENVWHSTFGIRHFAFVICLVTVAGTAACAQRRDRQLAATFDEAKLATRRGELDAGRALAERGASQAPADSVWAWKFRFLRGEILLLQHQPAEVTPLITVALPGDAAFTPLRARQKFIEALVQRSQNRFADALATLTVARGFAADDRDVQLDIAWLDGQLRMRLGQWAEAETRLNAAVTAAGESGDRFQQARVLNDLGMGSLVRGRCDEALPRFERVLTFQDLDSLSIYAAALSNAGICYSRLGQFDRALAIQRRSITVHTGRGTRADYAKALAGLGNTFILQGDSRQGLPYLQQALAVAKESNLGADAALWAGSIAGASVELANWDEAERFNEEAKALKTASRTGSLVHNTLYAAKIARGRGQLDEATRLFEKALVDGASDPAVRWSAHAGLAAVALNRKQPDEAERHLEAAFDTIGRTQSDLLKTDYKLTFLTSLIRLYQLYVDVLVDQGRTDRALEVSESSRGRVLADRSNLPPPAKVSAVALRQVAARSRSVLLSYWLAPERSYVWVVTPGAIRCLPLPPAREIETLVREYQTAINDTLADPLASSGTAGDRLYQLLVQPAAQWLPPGTHVVIAADGALHGINFETLPVPGARRHYWIEDVEVVVAPGLSVLSAGPIGRTPAASLLLIGDPAARAPEFPALKYAAAEMANVSKHFPAGAVTSYQGDRASPAAYRTAAPERFTFVHFTAHAAANLESPLDSAVILTGPDAGYKLYARDVAALPLHAELVTVSACRSAGERAYSGEGLVGFAWAFLRAGATRVIAGLWDVDDRSTADLMDHLYTRIAAGDPASRALRDAKLSLLAKGGNYGKPYYWGPFQVFTVVP